MSKYEKDSELLFVTSEANFGNNGIGNQNHFKVNLADSPLKNNDSSLIKLSVKELQLRKSWYNINETNNKVRLSMEGFSTGTGSTVVMPDIDTMVEIPVGDYVTHESLVDSFGNAVITALINATNSPLVAGNLVATALTEVFRNVHSNGTNGVEIPKLGIYRNDFRLLIELDCTITDWVWVKLPIFQFLNIPLANDYKFNITDGASLKPNERFNDSYILLGGPRIEEFQGTIADPIWTVTTKKESLSVKKMTSRLLYIASWFPMSEVLHTLDDVYVISRQSRSQASSSLQSITNEHAHTFIASNLVAKASRDVQDSINDVGVYFKITQPSYFFSILSQPFINEIEFQLTDHRGRDLPYNPTDTVPVNAIADNIQPYSGAPQIENGNSVVSLVILAEKFIGASPNSLDGFPDPVGIYNPKFGSNITIPNKFC